jgi:hypothetical protein
MLGSDAGQKKASVNLSRIRNTFINFIIPIIAIAASVALSLIILLPAYKSLPDLKVSLHGKKEFSALLLKKTQVLNDYRDYASVLDQNSTLIDKVLVSEEDPLALQDQLYQIALASGFNISKLSYSSGGRGTTPEGLHDLVSISMGGQSTYTQLVTFMQWLENAARFVQVSTFRYSADRDSGTFNVELSVESPYLYVDSTAVTDEPIELDMLSDEFVTFINKMKTLNFYTFQGMSSRSLGVEEVDVSEEGVESAEDANLPENHLTAEELAEYVGE